MNAKEFIKALNNITEEKNISKDIVFEAMELALATAYKKNFDSKTNVEVKINRETGDIKVYSYFIVVNEYDNGTETTDEEGKIVKVPPTINLDNQDEHVANLDYVPHKARDKKVRAALSNSFGFGGHNATLIFKEV